MDVSRQPRSTATPDLADRPRGALDVLVLERPSNRSAQARRRHEIVNGLVDKEVKQRVVR
jgi:hypothetical protein